MFDDEPHDHDAQRITESRAIWEKQIEIRVATNELNFKYLKEDIGDFASPIKEAAAAMSAVASKYELLVARIDGDNKRVEKLENHVDALRIAESSRKGRELFVATVAGTIGSLVGGIATFLALVVGWVHSK